MLEDSKNFEKYVKLCGGNRYVATTFVSKQAKILAEKYQNVISYSEALTWIISGKAPKIISNYKYILKQREKGPLILADSMLSNIQDEKIKQSVLESIKRSNKVGHLIYFYKDVYDKYRRARIRILTNIIWDEMRKQGEFDY